MSNHRRVTLDLTAVDTILDIKEKINILEGVSSDQYKIMFGGKILQDNSTLSECGVKNESFLEIIFGKYAAS